MDKTQDTDCHYQILACNQLILLYDHTVFARALTGHSPQLRLLKLKQALLHKRLLYTKHATTAQHHMEEKEINYESFFQPSFLFGKQAISAKAEGEKQIYQI